MLSIKNLGMALCIFMITSQSQAQHPAPLPSELVTSKEVIWARTDFAPYFILKGDYQNKGISDQVILYFSKNIEGFEHHRVAMSLKRMLKNARSGVAICHVALLKNPERETFIDYSIPIMRSYPNGIITTSTGLYKLGLSPDNIKPIKLTDLLDKNLTISVHDGRSYSPYIDKIIKQEQHKTNSIFQMKTGLKEHERLVLMITNNRIDGLIARPEEVQFINIEQKLEETLYFVEIQDSSSTDISYVGCSKGPWNKALLTKINQLIKQDQDLSKTINDTHKAWLPTHMHDSHILK